jgi:hypothetical protein
MSAPNSSFDPKQVAALVAVEVQLRLAERLSGLQLEPNTQRASKAKGAIKPATKPKPKTENTEPQAESK